MARGVQGGGCVIVHVVAWAAHPQIRTPQGSPRGETESRFLWVCRVKAVGQTVQGIPTGDAWSYGLRRRIDPLPANGGLEEDQDALSCESLHRRFFEVWEIGLGARESVRRPEHLFIQTEVVGVAFGSLLNPSTFQTMWASRSAYPQPA